MAKEKFDIVCEKLALKHGTSAKKVKQEMKIAIETAFKNPTTEQKAFQDTIPRKGETPTYEEVIDFIIQKLGLLIGNGINISLHKDFKRQNNY